MHQKDKNLYVSNGHTDFLRFLTVAINIVKFEISKIIPACLNYRT